jgi:hypothetical protein
MKTTWLLTAVLLAGLALGEAPVPDAPRRPVRAAPAALRAVDDTRREAARAYDRWQAAHRAALRDDGWEALLRVGRAARQLGDTGGDREAWRARSRDAYLTALGRARQDASLDGVLEVAEALADLGDGESARLAIGSAERLAGADAEALADVQAVSARLADLVAQPGPGAPSRP